MRKNCIMLGLLSCFLLFPVSAGSPLGLGEVLAMAQANNLGLLGTTIDVNAAKRDVDTAWNLFLPQVNASLSHSGRGPGFAPSESLYGGIVVEDSFVDSGLSLGFSVNITLNAAVREQMESYKIGYQIQQVTYAQAKAEVQRTATKLFYYLVMEAENIKVQQANLNLAWKQYEQVKTKYEQGFASEMEVLTAELSHERLKSALQQAENQYNANLLSLKMLLGMGLDDELVIEGQVPSLLKPLEVQELNEYLEKSYSIALIDLNLAKLEKTKELNRMQAFTPTVSFQGSYGLSAFNDNYSNDFSDSASYSVSVSLPLDGFIPDSRTKVGLASLDDSLEKLHLQRQQAVQQLQVSVVTQVQNLNMLASQAKLAEQSLELTKKLYAMNLIQYESGYIGLVDLEEAQNNHMTSEQNLLSVQYQYISSLIDLLYDLNIHHEFLTKELQ